MNAEIEALKEELAALTEKVEFIMEQMPAPEGVNPEEEPFLTMGDEEEEVLPDAPPPPRSSKVDMMLALAGKKK